MTETTTSPSKHLWLRVVKETQKRAQNIISELHREKHIDDMTKKCLSETPNPPRIPVYNMLMKIYKPTPVGRPIISGCDGPTERISSFVDHILQPIAKTQKSNHNTYMIFFPREGIKTLYVKDSKHFIKKKKRSNTNPLTKKNA